MTIYKKKIFKKIFFLFAGSLTLLILMYGAFAFPMQKSSLIEVMHSEAYTLSNSISLACADAIIDEDDSFIVTHNMAVINKSPNIFSITISNNIDIQTNLGDNVEIEGYPSEFSQVVLNILSNAKDALVEHKKNDCAIVTIEDNAGGIPQDIIDKVFDPYFTTKEEGKGTGIGLYMTKTIVETNMEGELSVINENDGAKFTVYFSTK